MEVPFIDLKSQHESLKSEMLDAIEAVIDAGAFAGGAYVEEFEKAFSRFCETQEAVGVGSGTDALWLSLLALGVGSGDEVITVPNTFIATAEAISFAGATPRFVDVEESTFTMDPRRLEEAITKRTKAIIPVHLYGQMADMDPLLEIARRRGLFVIEDACQAHGARYKGRRAGSMGDVGCFSFYPGKNLGAFGEAGAVTTNNAEVARRIRMLRDHGQAAKYSHEVVGWNARMDGIQAAVLQIKLRKLHESTMVRRSHAEIYNRFLTGVGTVMVPQVEGQREHVYHLYVLRHRERDRVIRELRGKRIGCGIHYPFPLHLQQAYQRLNYSRGSFPIAEKLANEVVSLPICSGLKREQIEAVAVAARNSI